MGNMKKKTTSSCIILFNFLFPPIFHDSCSNINNFSAVSISIIPKIFPIYGSKSQHLT
uniref:Uncharacterized protein n=1 Tax=Rhizophora mucronata TaxID=61149 RepID=A0A2P2QPW4_RHIMU